MKSKKTIPTNIKPQLTQNSDSTKEELLALSEASLLPFLLEQQKQQRKYNKLYDENQVAQLVDKWTNNNEFTVQCETNLLMEAYKNRAAQRMMVSTKSTQKPVPENLISVIEHSLEQAEQKNEILQKDNIQVSLPTVIVELARDYLTVVKSSLQGFYAAPPSEMATRSASPSTVPSLDSSELASKNIQRQDHVLLYQKQNDTCLCYNIFRDSPQTVVLMIKAPETYRETRVCLRKEGHLIASGTFDKQNGKLSFHKLNTSKYTIEFSGDMDYSMELIIRDRKT